MATIYGTQQIIKGALLKSKLGFKCTGTERQWIYIIPKCLIEFEVCLEFNTMTNQYDLIRLEWCYIGPNWKFLSMIDIFDYPLPDKFKEFLIYNIDLFSKPQFHYLDLVEALERYNELMES